VSPAISKADTQQQLEALEARVSLLETRLAQLSAHIELNPLLHDLPASSAGSREAAPETARPAPPLQLQITPELASVIRLVQQGHGDAAQRELRRIPEEHLAQQPEVVALVAAALCVQRGDYATGLKALERARTLTNDPRLLRVMQLIEEQAG
jgi:hypothetical protein